MRKTKDKIHYSQQMIMGYNKPITFVLSKRGSGKSTAYILMAWKYIMKGYNVVFIRRRITDITVKYIDSIVSIYNSFNHQNLKVFYKLKDDGVCDVKDENGKTLFSVLGLSAKEERLKSIILDKCKLIIYDEFIIRPKLQGRYLPNEYAKFQMAYTTIAREYDYKTRVVFIGNPYTLYNPYFHALGIDTNKIKEDSVIVGDKYVIEYYKVSEELQKVIDNNPFKDEEDEVDAQDDIHIKLFDKLPSQASLKFLVFYNGRYIGFWYINGFWYIQNIKYKGKKQVYVFDLNDIENGTILYTREDRFYISLLNQAVRKGRFFVNSISTYYDFRYIYDIM